MADSASSASRLGSHGCRTSEVGRTRAQSVHKRDDRSVLNALPQWTRTRRSRAHGAPDFAGYERVRLAAVESVVARPERQALRRPGTDASDLAGCDAVEAQRCWPGISRYLSPGISGWPQWQTLHRISLDRKAPAPRRPRARAWTAVIRCQGRTFAHGAAVASRVDRPNDSSGRPSVPTSPLRSTRRRDRARERRATLPPGSTSWRGPSAWMTSPTRARCGPGLLAGSPAADRVRRAGGSRRSRCQ